VPAFLLDIESGGELNQTFADLTTVRVAHVDGLTAGTLDSMLWDALVFLSTLNTTDPPELDIVLGQVHPSIPTIVITNLAATPVPACDRVRVEITYGIPRVDFAPPAAADGTDHKSVRYFGQARRVTRDPRDGTTELTVAAPPAYFGMANQTKAITVNESLAVVLFERSERFVPTARMRTYQNTVNSVQLPLVTPLYPVGTVYCNTITADTRDQGGLYLVRYEFLYNPDGHKIEYKWERASLDVPAYDAGSRVLLEPYRAEDFAALGLNFSD